MLAVVVVLVLHGVAQMPRGITAVAVLRPAKGGLLPLPRLRRPVRAKAVHQQVQQQEGAARQAAQQARPRPRLPLYQLQAKLVVVRLHPEAAALALQPCPLPLMPRMRMTLGHIALHR